jgi:hypothetical protein
MVRWLSWLLFAAVAAMPSARAATVVGTLDASGEIRIGPDGRVLSHTLSERVPTPVAEAISRSVATWTFEPVLEDGVPVIAETRMHLTIEALEHSRDELALRVRQVWFGDELVPEVTRTPVYPQRAIERGVGARVLLALWLGPDGRVLDAHPYRTSFAAGTDRRLASRLRRDFERASVAAARTWRYAPELVASLGPSILVPVQYSLHRELPKQASWFRFDPGEIVPPPWPFDPSGVPGRSSLEGGVAVREDPRIRLRTEVAGTML